MIDSGLGGVPRISYIRVSVRDDASTPTGGLVFASQVLLEVEAATQIPVLASISSDRGTSIRKQVITAKILVYKSEQTEGEASRCTHRGLCSKLQITYSNIPTQTQVESGTSQSKSGTSVDLSDSGMQYAKIVNDKYNIPAK